MATATRDGDVDDLALHRVDQGASEAQQQLGHHIRNVAGPLFARTTFHPFHCFFDLSVAQPCRIRIPLCWPALLQPDFTLAAEGSIVLEAFVLSALAFGLWSALLKHNPVGQVTIYNFLIPVFA